MIEKQSNDITSNLRVVGALNKFAFLTFKTVKSALLTIIV